jgi:hypothetical protein
VLVGLWWVWKPTRDAAGRVADYASGTSPFSEFFGVLPAILYAHRDAEKGDVKDVMALTPPTQDAAAGDASAEGVRAPSTFRAVRNVIQESTIWKTLNYGMNYDIHKVHILLSSFI